MATFKAGFGRVNITPPLGVNLAGYYHERISEGILNELQANCLAVNDGENTAVLFSCDLLYCSQGQIDYTRELISKTLGMPIEQIFIACTHTHTGPYCLRGNGLEGPLSLDNSDRVDMPYLDMLARYMASAAQLAVNDLSEATADIGRNVVRDVTFIRGYRMKDGTVRNGPGFHHPDIVGYAGEPDETLQVLRFNREGKKSITVVNFQVHADMVGFNKISADYPHFLRETVETVYPDTHCIFFNGPEGNLGCTNFLGDPNLYDKFRATDRLRLSRHVGRSLAGGVMQIYEKLTPVTLGTIKGTSKTVKIPTNRVTDAAVVAEAERLWNMHVNGHDDESLGTGMAKITELARISRILKLKDGPDAVSITVHGIVFGEVAFAGFPGEPFTSVGKGTKARAPYTMTIPCALTNGADGYFPDADSYRDGGYEPAASVFAPGVAEKLTDTAVELLNELK